MKTPEKKHATFSASGAERWLACPGSIELTKKAPPSKSSAYADEGTNAHTCLEVYLKNGRSKAVASTTMLIKTYPEDMVALALQSAKVIWSVAGNLELLSETKVDLQFVRPGMFGTVDAAVVDLFDTLHVFDFKYGAGIPVDPDDNPQLIYYALGLAHEYDYDFQKVVLHILQPRADHIKGWHREWSLSIDDLMGWAETFRRGVEACEDPLATYVAGDHCRFCPAKPLCPAIADHAFQDAALDFAPIADSVTKTVALSEPPSPQSISALELPTILSALPKIKTWIDAVESYAQDILEHGGSVPGFKLVQKRSTRQWTDREAALTEAYRLWKEKCYSEPELLSPAQLEKRIGKAAKDFTARYTTNVVPKGHTMVKESDPRPAVNAIEDDFGDDKVKTRHSANLDFDWAKDDIAPKSEMDWKKRNLVKRKFAKGSRKNGTKTSRKKGKK